MSLLVKHQYLNNPESLFYYPFMIMEKNFKNLFGLIKEKSVPIIDPISEETRNGMHKAYIPRFLYKPPFGYPRYVDLLTIRRLAASPYVEMCISTIIDEICSVPWDIVAKEGKDPEKAKAHIDHAKSFYDNPNTNKESLEDIRRKYLRDLLEIDSGVLNKIFNQGGEMVEMVARDGGTFTKNPDIYGMMTDREDLILDSEIQPPNKEMSAMAIEPGFITAADARERAAYFQYGWISGARPIPFGKKEIIWFERNPRTDSIYGRAPVQILAETVQTLIYAIEHNLEYFSDNQIPRGIIGLEGSNTDEVKAFKEQWKENMRVKDSAGNWRKKFHHIPVTNKTPVFTRLELSNSELELLEGQKWWAKLVWACFGVTATELGYTEDGKGLANQIVQSNVFRKRAIYPILRMEEYKHNREIISEFEYDDIEFKFLLFDVEEETKKAGLYKIQLDAGYKSVNEIRNEEGLEEVDWGDKQTAEEEMEMNNKYSDPLTKEKGELEKESEMQSRNKEKKALQTESPLILRENETMTEDRFTRSIVYVLEESEKLIKDLIKKEMGNNKLIDIKSIDDIAKRIKELITFQGLKTVSDAVIRQTFMKGWESAEKQVNKNFMVNTEAIDFIQDYTFNNIKSMTEEIATDLRQELERGIMAGEGVNKLKARVSKVFDVGEVRAEAIARTETNRAEGQGKLQAFKASGDDFDKRWISTIDARTSQICRRLNGQTVGMNENFKDAQTGWEGPIHPAHVNCRSAVVFISKEEINQKALQRERLAKQEAERELSANEIAEQKSVDEEIKLNLQKKDIDIKDRKAALLKRLEEDNARNKNILRE